MNETIEKLKKMTSDKYETIVSTVYRPRQTNLVSHNHLHENGTHVQYCDEWTGRCVEEEVEVNGEHYYRPAGNREWNHGSCPEYYPVITKEETGLLDRIADIHR